MWRNQAGAELEACSGRLAYMILESAVRATGRELLLTVLPPLSHCVLRYKHGGQDRPAGAVVAQLSWMQPISFYWLYGQIHRREYFFST